MAQETVKKLAQQSKKIKVEDVVAEVPVFQVLNLWALSHLLKDRLSTINWLQEQGLLPSQRRCPKCKRDMILDLSDEGHGLGFFRCRRKHPSRLGDVKISIADGTWFAKSSLNPVVIMIIVYCFAREMTYQQVRCEASISSTLVSSETISDWYNYCREICMAALHKKFEEQGKIGGPGRYVEVDELRIGKVNIGHLVEGQWVLGMLDVTYQEPGEDLIPGDFRLELCPENKRDGLTLLGLIQNRVLPGTIILTNCWKAYSILAEIECPTVAHSYTFVDPATLANTKYIEADWRPFKNRIRRGVSQCHMESHLYEYLWRRGIRHEKKDPFLALLQDIRMFYPGHRSSLPKHTDLI